MPVHSSFSLQEGSLAALWYNDLKSSYEVRNKLKFLIFWSSKISILIDTALQQILTEGKIPSVKGQSQCFGLSGPHMVSTATTQVAIDNIEMNELCSNRTLSVDPGISEFQTFHVSWNLLIFVQLFKKVTIFSLQATQNQAVSWVWPTGHLLCQHLFWSNTLIWFIPTNTFSPWNHAFFFSSNQVNRKLLWKMKSLYLLNPAFRSCHLLSHYFNLCGNQS